MVTAFDTGVVVLLFVYHCCALTGFICIHSGVFSQLTSHDSPGHTVQPFTLTHCTTAYVSFMVVTDSDSVLLRFTILTEAVSVNDTLQGSHARILESRGILERNFPGLEWESHGK